MNEKFTDPIIYKKTDEPPTGELNHSDYSDSDKKAGDEIIEQFIKEKENILKAVRSKDIYDAYFDRLEKYIRIYGSTILQDEDIRQAISETIFNNESDYSGMVSKEVRAVNDWGLSMELLEACFKKRLLRALNKKSFNVSNATSYIVSIRDLLNDTEINEMAVQKAQEWRFVEIDINKFDSGLTAQRIVADLRYFIRDFKLPSELLEKWKVKIAESIIPQVENFEQLKNANKYLHYLDISDSSLEPISSKIFIQRISNDQIGQAMLLKENFLIKIENTELQKAGESGAMIALGKQNLEDIEKIHEWSHLSPEFFAQPEVNHKISQLLADQFLCRGEFKDLVEKTDLFGLSSEAYSIMDTQASGSEQLSSNLNKFIRYLGDEDIFVARFPQTFERVKEMIFAKLADDQDLADYFIENLNNYYQQPWAIENVTKAIQQYSVAQKFIHATENDQTIWKDELWVANVLAKAKAIVEEHQKQWQQDDQQDNQQDNQETDEYGYSHGNESFSESDPYENHPWRFDEHQIRLASFVSDLMEGKIDAQELEKIGINAQEITPFIIEVNEKINTAYQIFLEQIRSNPNIKEGDSQALLNPESSTIKMIPLLDNIRSFIARYFVQSIEGSITNLLEIGNLSKSLDRILTEGFKRYIKIHEVDIPLYDKLYEEFDNLRETGRSPLEVYLGRDGIYAYIGRHSQDVARRRKLGLEGRKKLKELGEVIEIHPQYTIYPRYFRDYLNYETKRQFLQQEGISPDADPLFYDTGYTGTIPEQIMKVMDFSQEDIEQRIRLLSAPSVNRRVKGIPENARGEVIEYIEHNAKTENVAEGLIIDKKTGKIRHIAKPTNPEEQFYFMMVKQAIARHYWLQEQLHYEPSGNVNLDSEHYTIRIRQEYAKLLPLEFMRNPKDFLKQHGELLKGSKGEGKYPDEEIILFKLSDGTEIVAKRIELRKSKEARKEFSILIAAKKAGLPTAEPVGFLSGKEETDGSYLLMKKLEGRSGRHFEKELRESGKYSDEQINSIIKIVAERNREMAELFRETLDIDKRWRIKDTIIEFDEETGKVGAVIPIDWERVQSYNPNTPKEID